MRNSWCVKSGCGCPGVSGQIRRVRGIWSGLYNWITRSRFRRVEAAQLGDNLWGPCDNCCGDGVVRSRSAFRRDGAKPLREWALDRSGFRLTAVARARHGLCRIFRAGRVGSGRAGRWGDGARGRWGWVGRASVPD